MNTDWLVAAGIGLGWISMVWLIVKVFLLCDHETDEERER